MALEDLTLQRIEARPLVLKLERPIVARIASITDWPVILIDLYTDWDGNAAAMTNFRFIANATWTTEEAVAKMTSN